MNEPFSNELARRLLLLILRLNPEARYCELTMFQKLSEVLIGSALVVGSTYNSIAHLTLSSYAIAVTHLEHVGSNALWFCSSRLGVTARAITI